MKNACACILLASICLATPAIADLYSYVNYKDGEYKWELVSESDLSFGSKLYEIKLTSQKWHDIIWEHTLRLIVPPNAEEETNALLLITGGNRNREKGTEEVKYGNMIALGIQAPVAILYDVPYQPLFDNLREDALISYTFTKYLETGDDTWPLLLPMTKSAVKAMDAVQEFGAKQLQRKITGFVVTGGSKRGWTTWLSSVVDKRVIAIAPMVYDNLDLPGQMRHQIEAWGEFSEQIHDYTERDLPQLLIRDELPEELTKLQELVDPFVHLDQINIPKLVITGTNDRYWVLDALNLYWDQMSREKYVLYVPNSGHGLEDIDRVISTVICFFTKTSGKLEFPDLRWEIDKLDNGARLHVASNGVAPAKFQVWLAEAPTRDFRESKWNSKEIEPNERGVYTYAIEKPETGYKAMFGEAVYKTEDGKQFYLSTQVVIVGDGD